MKILAIKSNTWDNTFEPMKSEYGYQLEYADTWEVASEKMYLYEYDCILIHSLSKDQKTYLLITELNKGSKTSGLIILSEDNGLEEKVGMLVAGADDYLQVPYHPEELKARILAVVRRKKFNGVNKIHFANTVIDLHLKNVFVWDNSVSLTRKEYDILVYFIMNRNRTLSQLMIAEYLWGEGSENKENSNLLVSHIKNLRKKLKAVKAEIEIKNIYGVGYQIIEL